MKKAIITNCRNKIAFGGLSERDAKEFAVRQGQSHDAAIDVQKQGFESARHYRSRFLK